MSEAAVDRLEEHFRSFPDGLDNPRRVRLVALELAAKLVGPVAVHQDVLAAARAFAAFIEEGPR